MRTDLAEGPYVTAALLCEQVTKDPDGLLNVSRVIEVVNINTMQWPLDQLRSGQVGFSVTLFISLKSGRVTGKRHLSIIFRRPSQPDSPSEVKFPVVFEGEDKGINLVLPINGVVLEEGLHWFDIFLDDERITRIPLRIIFVQSPPLG